MMLKITLKKFLLKNGILENTKENDVLEKQNNMFSTIEEYEEYLDRLYSLVEYEHQYLSKKLEQTDSIIPCKECFNSRINTKYAFLNGSISTLASVLTYFSVANQNDNKSNHLYKNLMGKYNDKNE